MKKPQLAGLAIALAIVVAGKQYFRSASADDLRWLLAPTARCVSVLTRTHFTHAVGLGYVDRDVNFVIAPVCAGLNFMLAAILALTFGWCAGMQSWRAAAERLVAIIGLAYAATIVVNTLRISLSIETHAGGELHRIEGVVVYLGGLCALYAAARRLDDKTIHNARWLAVPIAAYLLITLLMPLAHGAAGRADFAVHAMWVLAGCLVVGLGLAGWSRLANNRTSSRVPKGPL
ncbi:MAG: exosortase K [Kofleriaceae bacterium]